MSPERSARSSAFLRAFAAARRSFLDFASEGVSQFEENWKVGEGRVEG